MNDTHTSVYLYVVGALPRLEAEEFEAHLADCAACETELAELRDVSSQLSQSVATEAPAELRSAVLATIARTPQTPAVSHRSTSDDSSELRPPAALGTSTSGSSGAKVVPLRRSSPNRLPALLSAAAVLAAVAVGGWAFQTQHDAQQSQQAAELATTKTHLIGELLSADDVAVISARLTSTGGTGAVVMSPSQQQAMFVAADLPALPEGKVYEAWTIDQGSVVPAATFSAAEAKTTVILPREVFDARRVAVTVEPAGGSQTPTTDPVFLVSVPG